MTTNPSTNAVHDDMLAELAELLGEGTAIIAILVDNIDAGGEVLPHRLDMARRFLAKQEARHARVAECRAIEAVEEQYTAGAFQAVLDLPPK